MKTQAQWGIESGNTYLKNGGTWEEFNASKINFIQNLTNAQTISAMTKMRETVHVMDFIPAGTDLSTTDVAQYINNGLNALAGTGKYLAITNGTYRVGAQIVVPSNTGIIGDGTGKLFALNSYFNNVYPTAPYKYNANNNVIDCSGLTVAPYTPNENQVVSGIKLEYEFQEGYICNGITARNCKNLEISNNEIFNFPLSLPILVASLQGNSVIRSNYIHDCTSNSTFVGGTSGNVQITAIDIDDDRITSAPGLTDGKSQSVRVESNYIENITQGPVAIAAYGYQYDAIRLQNGYGHIVTNNVVDITSQGIDIYASNCIVSNNAFYNCDSFSIKLIHGASNNIVNNNYCYNCGLAGIVVAGGVNADTNGNIFTENVIINVDSNLIWAANTSACILLENQGTFVASNNIFERNHLNPGANGKYCIVNDGIGDLRNRFSFNDVSSGTSGVYNISVSNYPQLDTRIKIHSLAFFTGTITIPSGDWTKIAFNAIDKDFTNNFDTTTSKFTCNTPGFYKMEIMLRIPAAKNVVAAIYKNGSVIERFFNLDLATAADQSCFVSSVRYLQVGDYIEAYMYHNSGSDRDLTQGSDYTYFNIYAV